MYSPCTDASMASVVDAFTDSATTAMNTTSPTPIISADAVLAVRRGFRRAFSRARRPVTPQRRGSGAPISRASAGAVAGPSTARPVKASRAPMPMRWREPSPSAARPHHTAAAPAARINRASTSLAFDRPVVSTATSRMAAIGGTVAARRAGKIADTRVMPVPTSSDDTTAEAGTMIGVSGPANPISRSNALRPMARRIPNPTPTAEATAPTAAASSITEPSTCRRLAPTARSRASSRVRWATMIENVL
jgi:hypothetical protein